MKQFGWQVVGCSMPAMQRQERHGLQELIIDLESINSDLLPTLTFEYCSDYTIDVQQVMKRLRNINVYKATGPHFLPSWILRDFDAYLMPLSEKGPYLIFGSLL